MGRVIVRMWECRVKPGCTDELARYVREDVWPQVTAIEGFLGGELLRSVARDDERLLLMTRWSDESALEKYLGPRWTETELSPIPSEEPYIEGVPFVDNWEPVG